MDTDIDEDEDMETFDQWFHTDDKDEYIRLSMKLFKVDEAEALRMWEHEQEELAQKDD